MASSDKGVQWSKLNPECSINPKDSDGKLIPCIVCESYRHFIANFPDNFRKRIHNKNGYCGI